MPHGFISRKQTYFTSWAHTNLQTYHACAHLERSDMLNSIDQIFVKCKVYSLILQKPKYDNVLVSAILLLFELRKLLPSNLFLTTVVGTSGIPAHYQERLSWCRRSIVVSLHCCEETQLCNPVVLTKKKGQEVQTLRRRIS